MYSSPPLERPPSGSGEWWSIIRGTIQRNFRSSVIRVVSQEGDTELFIVHELFIEMDLV